jgi:hypothetical protein
VLADGEHPRREGLKARRAQEIQVVEPDLEDAHVLAHAEGVDVLQVAAQARAHGHVAVSSQGKRESFVRSRDDRVKPGQRERRQRFLTHAIPLRPTNA